MNKERLIEIYLASLEIERTVGIPALFSTAQAILESTWDLKSILNSNNIYGIKWHNYYSKDENDYVIAETKEYENGKWVIKKLKFQKYNNLGDCIRDHSRLLIDSSLGYLQPLIDYRKDKNLERYVQRVALIYATDPEYARKVMILIKDIKEVIDSIKTYEIEKEEAKTSMINKGILKSTNEVGYWTRPINREELAVILERIARGGA